MNSKEDIRPAVVIIVQFSTLYIVHDIHLARKQLQT